MYSFFASLVARHMLFDLVSLLGCRVLWVFRRRARCAGLGHLPRPPFDAKAVPSVTQGMLKKKKNSDVVFVGAAGSGVRVGRIKSAVRFESASATTTDDSVAKSQGDTRWP